MKRKNGLNKKLNMTKVVLAIGLCISIILQPSIYVSGETTQYGTYYIIGSEGNTYTFSDLLYWYKSNSVAYKRNMLEYQIQAMEGRIASGNHSNVESQHFDLINNIEELKNIKRALLEYKNELLSQKSEAVTGSAITIEETITKDKKELIDEIDAQITSIDLQLIQFEDTKSSLDTSLTSTKLTKDISDFYVNYQNMLEDEVRRKLENDFLKQCYGLMIYQEQLDYNKAYQDYLDLINEVDRIRYQFGIVTNSQLDINDANSLHNRNEISQYQNTYKSTMKYIGREVGNTSEKFGILLHLINIKKEYNPELTIREFINNNSSYQQTQNYIRSYQEYHDSAHLVSYSLYQKSEIQIEYYSLQKTELEDSIRGYVEDAIDSYEKAFYSCEATWKDLQVKISSYNAMTSRFTYKRASKLEVLKSLYEMEAAEVTYYQSCYEIVVWQNILDNYIYGATP